MKLTTLLAALRRHGFVATRRTSGNYDLTRSGDPRRFIASSATWGYIVRHPTRGDTVTHGVGIREVGPVNPTPWFRIGPAIANVCGTMRTTPLIQATREYRHWRAPSFYCHEVTIDYVTYRIERPADVAMCDGWLDYAVPDAVFADYCRDVFVP